MAAVVDDTPLGLTSHIYNLSVVLTRKALRVPRYQRPYTWGDNEVRELIQDLWRAYERRASFYFVGQIVLVKAHGVLEVSDGQQRLATLTMMLAYTRDRLPGRAKHMQSFIMDGDTPRFSLREGDHASFFRGNVQEPGRMAVLAKHPETGNDTKDLLVIAARTIAAQLDSVSDRDLDAFIAYVMKNCTLNVVDADERGCAATVFNSLNKRGSPLSGADIIKSDLIENSGLSEAKANGAAEQWEQIEEMFSREHFSRLLYIMPFLLTGEPILSPGDLASFRTAVGRAGGVEKFLFDQFPRYAKALRSIFSRTINVGAASADVNRRIGIMSEVEKWDWAPPAIAFLAEHASQHERARRFFQALDRFTFACELAVIDIRERENRYAMAVKCIGDDKALHGPKALGLSDDEHSRFIYALNRSRKRDRQRRLLMMRLETAMPNGHMLRMTDDVTVEHVLPKGGGPWWDERFPDAKLRLELANLLGNLVLITHDQNKAADNKPYPQKRKVYFDWPDAPIHAVTKDLASIEEWTFQAIEERHEKLVGILCLDWGLVRPH
ncbi:MAG: DUF262 domain-containing protein [Hyphomonadaceae bacterium]